MKIGTLINDLERDGVKLWAEGDELRFRAPRGVLTEERRAVLRAHRDQIVEHLRRGEDVTLTPRPEERHEPFPLSDLQAAYLLGRGDVFDYGGVACHAYVELAYPELDPARAEEAWNALVARHDMLRAVVHSDGSQVVLPQVPRYRVEVAADPAEVRRELAQRVPRPDRWPLFDLRITRSPEHALLHLSLDLLIVDYASVQILLAEFDSLYADPAAPLPPLEITFRDYVLARRRMTDTARYDRDRAYWLRRMEELPPAPELPLAGAPAGGETGEGPRFRRLEAVLSPAQWASLRERAARHGVTPSAALLTAYAEVIGRWSRSPRFTLNLPAFQRLPLHPDVPGLVGDFTSVELLGVDLSAEVPFAGRAAQISGQLLDDLAHPLFTGAEVLAELSRRGGEGPVLMPVVFTSTLDAAPAAPGRGRVAYAVSQTPQVWIDCQAMPRGETLAVSWDVREGVLPGGLADDAFASFAGLVRRLAEDDDVWGLPGPVELPPAQAERRRRVNDTAGPLPDGLLHQGVVEQALRTPDAVAVQAPGLSLTYAELLARARAVAARLTAEGVRPAEPVAVLMDKGAEQIAGVLGTLLAGAAYLPVDTTQPAARRNTIIGDAGARVVLTQSWLADAAAPPAGCVPVAVDTLPPAPDGPVPASPAAPDDLAYVIYTSGSTGTPKGVMISHRAALNTVQDVNRRFQVTADDAVLGVASLGFDLSVYDVFGLLSAGGRLVLPDAHRRGDPSHWAELIRQTGVTVWNSVPGQMQMLHDYLRSAPEPDLPTLRLALLSGDWIPVTLPGQIRELVPGLRVISLGGATEGAIWSIFHPVAEGDASRPSIPYGTPLTNQSFHVLDAAMRDRPDWTPGELYIGGAGVARGYFADEARTAERFVTHPVTGERLYRTGDLGRYLPDGTIEFLGREDSQVKIRGYRIELAEVEAALVQHPSVAAGAVVVDAAHPAGKRLAAFVEPERRERAERAGDVPGPLIAEAAEAAASAAAPPIDPAALGDLLRALDEAALLVMEGALSRAGLFTDGAGHGAAGHNGTGYGAAGHSLDEVCDALRATARNRHIVRRWLRALTAEGRLGEDAGRYTGRLAADPGALERAWRRVEETERRVNWSPDLVEAMRACGERIDELLSGELDIRALLYPGAPSDAMTAAYRDNLAVHRLNKAVAAAVRAVAERHVGEERLRVLEVGGGVAGTTTELVPVLAEFPVEYTFTDPSQFFLNEAKERFADFPWVRYGRFDLNADPRAQGYLPNSFDVIVCANVLHNATDAAAALARLRELATPGGRLIFMENTDDENRPLLVSMEFMEVMSGPYQDVRAEGGQSFLTDEQWTRLLAEAGAELEACLPGPADPLRATGQRLFVARFKPDRARLTAGELTRHMATRLPEYMVPAHWQVVDALPLTGNGKVDRARLLSWLPRPGETRDAAARSGEPADALERQLAALWAELLDREHIGRHDDFFDLGGDSLLVARMVGRIRERIPDAVNLEWEVVLRHMLRHPTVAALAAYLGGVTAARQERTTARSSPLVRLHGSGEDPVTVLVHAGTGTVMPYRALITEIRRRSAGNATLTGLEIPDLREYLDAEPEGLIERLAAGYVEALLGSGASRLHVVGYCLGGLIATEVARGLAEAGADVATLTVISSHSPRFRLDDELLSEYSFSVMMGIDPAALGFPADENRVAAAADEVLAASPGVMRDGGFAELTGQYADVAACFQRLAAVPREQRVARMCEAVPASAGMYEPEHMMRLFRTFRQSVFAITRYDPEPYAGDITFLRHSGAYPFPGSKEAVTQHWEELCLGDLRIVDVAGDHFSCLSVQHAPGVLKLLSEITEGAVVR